MKTTLQLLFLFVAVSSWGQSVAVRISTNTPLAQGDQVIWSGSAWVPLNKGTNGQVLTMSGTNVIWATPSGGGGSGTVTSVGASTTMSGLGFSGSPVTTAGTLSLTGTVAVASGGTGATDASGARTALSLVPGTDVQAYDADLAAVAALANSGIIVRTGAGTVAARTITGDTEAVVTNGDGVSGNPTLSIGSAIARDAEVAATYAPLASAPLTGTPTVNGTNFMSRIEEHLTEAEASALYQRTNSTLTRVAGIGAGTEGDIIYRDANGWTNLAKGTTGQFLAQTATVPAWSNAPSGGGTWDGSPIPSGTITNLTAETINGIQPFSQNNGDISTEGFFGNVGAGSIFYPFVGAALSSGTIAATSANANDPGNIMSVSSASGANSGYSYAIPGTTYLLGGSESFNYGFYVPKTNAVVLRFGYLDLLTTTEPTDGVYGEMSGGVIYGRTASNSSRTSTTSTYVPVEDSTIRYRMTGVLNSAGTSVTFTIFTNGVSAWTDVVTNNIPTGASRFTGAGIVAYHTGTGAGTNVVQIGLLENKMNRALTR